MAGSLLDFLGNYGLGGGAPTGGYTPLLRPAAYDEAPPGAVPGLGLGEQYLRPGEAPSDAFGGLPVPYQPQQGLPAWAGGFGFQGAVPGSVPTPTTPPPTYNTMPASLQGGGRYAPANPQTVAPGVSALPTAPEERNPFMAALTGFFGGGSPMESIANAIGGATTGQRTDKAYLLQQQQKNQVNTTKAIFQGLMSRGDYHPDEAMAIAQAAAGDREVAKALLPQMFGQQKPAGEVKVGDLTIPYYMRKGEPRFIMPGGEHGGMQDVMDLAHKYTQGKQTAEAVGKSQGEAQQELPAAQSNVEAMLKEANDLKNHKGLKNSVGPIAGHLPPGALGTDQADFVARLNQLKGALSQAGIQSMRGSGLRITQTEAQWFGAAMGRLDRTVGEANIKTALGEIEDKLNTIYKNNQTKAGVENPSPAPGFQAPKPGTYNWSPAGGLMRR